MAIEGRGSFGAFFGAGFGAGFGVGIADFMQRCQNDSGRSLEPLDAILCLTYIELL